MHNTYAKLLITSTREDSNWIDGLVVTDGWGGEHDWACHRVSGPSQVEALANRSNGTYCLTQTEALADLARRSAHLFRVNGALVETEAEKKPYAILEGDHDNTMVKGHLHATSATDALQRAQVLGLIDPPTDLEEADRLRPVGDDAHIGDEAYGYVAIAMVLYVD